MRRDGGVAEPEEERTRGVARGVKTGEVPVLRADGVLAPARSGEVTRTPTVAGMADLVACVTEIPGAHAGVAREAALEVRHLSEFVGLPSRERARHGSASIRAPN